jgi:CsoR family transcriptional regulator, copper-sensing transcriptional repressor
MGVGVYLECAMQAEKKDVLNRLSYIEGHIKGIRKMVEEDKYCVDILKQTHAVKRALDKLDAVLLKGHLASCVPTGFDEGRGDEVMAELNELFELARR